MCIKKLVFVPYFKKFSWLVSEVFVTYFSKRSKDSLCSFDDEEQKAYPNIVFEDDDDTYPYDPFTF